MDLFLLDPYMSIHIFSFCSKTGMSPCGHAVDLIYQSDLLINDIYMRLLPGFKMHLLFFC